MPAVNAATGQVLSTRSPVEHGHRPVSGDTSLVVSGGVNCGRRRRNVYDKKPQRYAKDNRTAHLTARSDKSVTSNIRLYSTFCTVEAKLTTDRREASRSLFATAELIVEQCNRTACVKILERNSRVLDDHVQGKVLARNSAVADECRTSPLHIFPLGHFPRPNIPPPYLYGVGYFPPTTTTMRQSI